MRFDCVQSLLPLIPLLPLAGFLLNGFLGRRMSKGFVGLVGCGAPFASFVIACLALSVVAREGRVLEFPLFTWIASGDLDVSFALKVDQLGALMIMIVCGVGFLIHLYSIGYMAEDRGYGRYFAYLNLFMFSMLLLVMADNLLLMFVGWEGVGLCSYLLIGFWFEDLKNADAGKKAFIVNRVGDFGFILGIFILFGLYGTLDFSRMASSELSAGLLTVPALLLFVGACGKSAQIPLYVWLPDAMAGPTPVSALIHAATMVTAGIYMIARLNFLFAASPVAMQVIGAVAGLTAIFSAVIAVAQRDIKKILAYSTISQLGYMFIAMAAYSFTAGMFHLMTHAFFKALLFLSAGAVIHALSGEQDIMRMGGLRKKMKFIFAVFIVGSIAIAGVPPFAGFFSKDEILVAAYNAYCGGGGSLWLTIWALALATAFLTAFYTFRLIMLAFFGNYGGDEAKLHHIHQPGWQMKTALAVLALLSVVGGLLGGPLEEFLHPVWGGRMHETEAGHTLNMVLSIVCAFSGIFLAIVLYGPFRAKVVALPARSGFFPAMHKLMANKFYIDEIYETCIVAPLKILAFGLWAVVDRLLIDILLVNGVARLFAWVGGRARLCHTGLTNVSALFIVLGVVAALGFVCYKLLLAV